ncbi:MAG: LA_3659 family protein [Sphaerochaetaceae bacterium]
MWEVLPLLLSSGLFLLTLIIIFALRAADNRNHRFDVIKRKVAQYLADVKRSEDQFRENAAFIGENIATHKKEVEQVVSTIAAERTLIFSHAEDLKKMQHNLADYRQVLQQLSSLTDKAQIRTETVKQDIELIDQAKIDMAHQVAQLQNATIEVNTLLEQLSQQIADYSSNIAAITHSSTTAFEQELATLYNRRIEKADELFQAMIGSVAPILLEVDKQTDQLNTVVHTLSQKAKGELTELQTAVDAVDLHEKSLASLAQQKEEISAAIGELIRERDSLHDDVTRLQTKKESLQDELGGALEEMQRLQQEQEKQELLHRLAIDNPESYAGEEQEPIITETATEPVLFDGYHELEHHNQEHQRQWNWQDEPTLAEEEGLELDPGDEYQEVLENDFDSSDLTDIQEEGELHPFDWDDDLEDEQQSGQATEWDEEPFEQHDLTSLDWDDEYEDSEETEEERFVAQSKVPLARIESDYYEAEEDEEEIPLDDEL